MTFCEAVNASKNGARIQRKGWKGKSQYLESYLNAKGEVVNCRNDAIENHAVSFVGTSAKQMRGLVSQEDTLADDWIIVS